MFMPDEMKCTVVDMIWIFTQIYLFGFYFGFLFWFDFSRIEYAFPQYNHGRVCSAMQIGCRLK